MNMRQHQHTYIQRGIGAADDGTCLQKQQVQQAERMALKEEALQVRLPVILSNFP